jgi:lipid-A-disaccharide synthase
VGKTFEVMQASDLCLAVSGTVTLELACFRTPMVIVYRSNFWGRLLRPLVLKTKYIGLPNIIAGREVVPEFFLFSTNPAPITSAALSLLEDAGRRERCRADLDAVMRQLGEPGASARAATEVLRLAGRSA